MIEFSLNHGGNINAKNKNDYTPLHAAVEFGTQDMVQFLLTKGADITIKDERGYNAYELAVATNKNEIAEILKNSINCTNIQQPETELSGSDYITNDAYHEEYL